MSAESAAPGSGGSMWGSMARRVDPVFDPVIGVVAAGCALVSLLTTRVDAVDPRLQAPNVVAVVATALAAGSLAWRRKRPVLSYAVLAGGALVVSATSHYIGLLSLLILLSLYSLATHGRRRDALIGLAAGIASFVGLWAAGVPDLGVKDVLLACALLVAAWAMGDAMRSRREQQREQLRAVVTEERLRIARELHDVVAHSMSLIAIHAGVGAHLIRADPAAAEQSLEVIADTSRKALAQTRSMLGILRDERDDGTRGPTQWLDDLPSLVEDLRAAGLEVELVRSGAATQLDAATSLAAYRIVQESLTNVIKHSASRTAKVCVAADGSSVDLLVSDPGPTRVVAGESSSGHGLVGLDERARLLGGWLSHGAQDGGYFVHASLPAGTRG